MRSIRLSLIVYFLLLLAVALGAVSYLSYDSTRQALTEKEKSSAKLRQAQYVEDAKRVKEAFDRDIFTRARALAGRAFLISHQLDVPVILGMTMANLPTTAPGSLQLSIWDRIGEPFGKPPDEFAIWRRNVSRFSEVRLFAHDDDPGMPDDMLPDEVVDEGEYYQISSLSPRSMGKVLDRSHTLGTVVLEFDDTIRKKLGQGYFDDVKLRPGYVVRRVITYVYPKVKPGLQGYQARPLRKGPNSGARE